MPSQQREAVLLSKVALGTLRIIPLDDRDASGISALLDRYADQRFDLADACLMYLAEREQINHVFTLDRRHFVVYRTSKGTALSLLCGS